MHVFVKLLHVANLKRIRVVTIMHVLVYHNAGAVLFF